MEKDNLVGSDIKLPCGILNEDGGVERDAVIDPMRGRTREAIARKDIRNNGAKIVDVVLKSCLKSIGSKQVSNAMLGNMLTGDRDFLVLRIRQLSLGDRVEVPMSCPQCKERLDITLDLSEIRVKELSESDYEIENGERVFWLESKELEIRAKFRYPNGKDSHTLAEVSLNNPVAAQYMLYQRCLKEWNGQSAPFPAVFIKEKSVRELDWLTDEFAEKLPGPDFDTTVECSICGQETPLRMESSDFLFPRPRKAA